MGKRELVLVVAFIIVGAIVYQVTAPPLKPGQEGFSFGRLIQNARRTVHGRPAHVTVQSSRTEAIDSSVTELRVAARILDVTVIGEDRTDVAIDLRAESNGTDDADARQLATATALKIDRAGSGLVLGVTFPADGTQHAAVTVHVPRRLEVRVDNKIGRLEIRGVSAIDVKGNRGESKITDVAGEVALNHRGGALTIAGAGSLRLTAAGTQARVSGVHGTASIEITGSTIDISAIQGPLDMKTRGTDVKLHDLDTLVPPMRIDMQSGRLDIEGLAADTRVDGRDVDMRIAMARAAPMAISNTSDDITLTAPPGGYVLDAVVSDGSLTVDEPGAKQTGDEREKRASGAIRGGGPTITLRNTNGDITVRAHGGK